MCEIVKIGRGLRLENQIEEQEENGGNSLIISMVILKPWLRAFEGCFPGHQLHYCRGSVWLVVAGGRFCGL